MDRNHFIQLIRTLVSSEDVSLDALRRGRDRLDSLMASHPRRPSRARWVSVGTSLLLPRSIAAVATFLVVVAAVVAAAASRGALPVDGPLYSVKGAVETIQLALSPSPSLRVVLRSSFIDRRLDEAEGLLERADISDAQKSDGLRSVLAESLEQIKDAQGDLLALAQSDQSEEQSLIEGIGEIAQQQERRVRSLKGRSPLAVRVDLSIVESELLETEKAIVLRDAESRPAVPFAPIVQESASGGAEAERSPKSTGISLAPRVDVPQSPRPEDLSSPIAVAPIVEPSGIAEPSVVTAVQPDGVSVTSTPAVERTAAVEESSSPEGSVISDEDAELRKKARAKIAAAGEQQDVVHDRILQLHENERDQDRDVVLAADRRFEAALALLQTARTALRQGDFYAAFVNAIDTLKALAALEADIETLLEAIKSSD